tara:strand:+ start:3410 stop:4066 length:657 start_codon:yes stop_codon:yes gene_type:complete
MKKLRLVLSTCALALSATQVNAEVSANVAMTSDYVWRGITQTSGEGAIQGGFDYAHESGAYAGIWGSNVDFGTTADLEFDLYAGYATELDSGIVLDLGLIRYLYPDSPDTPAWNEIYGSVSYIGLTGGIAYTDDIYGGDVDGIYYSLSYDYALPKEVNLSASLGYYDVDSAASDSLDWKLAISREYQGVGFELAYFDIDQDDDSLDDDGFLFTLSKSM